MNLICAADLAFNIFVPCLDVLSVGTIFWPPSMVVVGVDVRLGSGTSGLNASDFLLRLLK